MTLKDVSRAEWGKAGHRPTTAEINAGSFQRIADACELMALNYRELQESYERARRELAWARRRLARAERSASALRGVITKMKKRGSVRPEDI